MEKYLLIENIKWGDILIITIAIVVLLFILYKYDQFKMIDNDKTAEKIYKAKNYYLKEKKDISYNLLIEDIGSINIQIYTKEFIMNLVTILSIISLLIYVLKSNIIFLYAFIIKIIIVLIMLENIKNIKIIVLSLESLLYEKYNIRINSKYPL